MIELNRKSRKLILLQRNELLSKKQKNLRRRFGRFIFTNVFVNFFQKKNLSELTEHLFQQELETFKSYLPKNINNILDIGCGLGVINIFLNRIYQNQLDFFMLDKDKIDRTIKYGFSENYESYNDLAETKNLLIKNGIKEEQIHLRNVDKRIEINSKIDLIISLKSMGYHYPLENYLNLLKEICTKDTEFIFDFTGGRYNTEVINKYFELSKVIYEEESIHPLKRLHCKGFKYL